MRLLMGEHLPDMRPDYLTLFSTKHGGAFDLSHEVDLAVWYADQPVRTVYALSATYADIGFELEEDSGTVRYSFGSKGQAAGSFQSPKALAVSRFNGVADGFLYVADQGNRRIAKLGVNNDAVEWIDAFCI